MKFDDVIVKEGLGDWMFGKKDGGASAGKQPTTKAPKIDGKAGLTPQDKLAYKMFTSDFVSDALSSINAGIRSGIINPPSSGNASAGASADSNLSETYTRLDGLLESIIEQSTEVQKSGGRSLSAFMKDWLSQWLKGTYYTHSKDVLYNIIDSLEKVYNSSSDPQNPTIDQNLLMQLADGGWAASATSNNPNGEENASLPDGAKNAKGRKEIEDALASGQKANYDYPQAPAGTTFKNQSYDVYVGANGRWTDSRINKPLSKDVGANFNMQYAKTPQHFGKPKTSGNGPQLATGTKVNYQNQVYTWLGAQWQSNQSKQMAPNSIAPELTKLATQNANAQNKQTVAESKTNSAIRAEKIKLLQTR